MKDFLERIKLLEYMTTEIDIKKEEFYLKFKESVDEGSISFFSNSFEVFSSSKNVYKGHVGMKDFKIKRRRRLFDVNMSLAVAKGTYRSKDNRVIIETEINGFSGMMIPFYILAIVFYLVLFIMMFVVNNSGNSEISFAFPFMLLHAIFMLGLPYFMMRSGVKKLGYELERDFFYMTKNKVN